MISFHNLLGEPTELSPQSLSILACFRKPITQSSFTAMVSTISLEYLLESRVPIDPVGPNNEEVERIFLKIMECILLRYGKKISDIPEESHFLRHFRTNRDVNDLLVSCLVMESLFQTGQSQSEISSQFIKDKFPAIFSYHWTLK